MSNVQPTQYQKAIALDLAIRMGSHSNTLIQESAVLIAEYLAGQRLLEEPPGRPATGWRRPWQLAWFPGILMLAIGGAPLLWKAFGWSDWTWTGAAIPLMVLVACVLGIALGMTLGVWAMVMTDRREGGGK